MKPAFKKSKCALIFVMGSWLVGMSFFFSACNNTPVSPPADFGSNSNHGGAGSAPPSSSSNYVVGAVGYAVTFIANTAVTTYSLAAAVAVKQTPDASAAVTFTDPNGTTQYPLTYAGSNVTIGGIDCGLYGASPGSFTTTGTFTMAVTTIAGTSSASVTAFNSAISFPSPYTTLSWTGTVQQNALSIASVATPSASYSQSGTTSPMNIPSSTYTSGVTYSYQLLQTNSTTTLSSGSGSLGYLQTTSGTFVAP